MLSLLQHLHFFTNPCFVFTGTTASWTALSPCPTPFLATRADSTMSIVIDLCSSEDDEQIGCLGDSVEWPSSLAKRKADEIDTAFKSVLSHTKEDEELKEVDEVAKIEVPSIPKIRTCNSVIVDGCNANCTLPFGHSGAHCNVLTKKRRESFGPAEAEKSVVDEAAFSEAATKAAEAAAAIRAYGKLAVHTCKDDLDPEMCVEIPAPKAPVMTGHPIDDDDDVQFVGRTGKNALCDFPHLRENCLEIKWNGGNKFQTCRNCYCYVCDVVSDLCAEWETHCMATHTDKRWVQMRAEQKKASDPALTASSASSSSSFAGSFSSSAINSRPTAHEIVNGAEQVYQLRSTLRPRSARVAVQLLPKPHVATSFIDALKAANKNSKLRIDNVHRSRNLSTVIDHCMRRWEDVLKTLGEYKLTIYESSGQPIDDIAIKIDTLCKKSNISTTSDAKLTLLYSAEDARVAVQTDAPKSQVVTGISFSHNESLAIERATQFFFG